MQIKIGTFIFISNIQKVGEALPLRPQFFSSPEPKARVSYCHSAPSVVRPSGVNFSHFRLLLQNCLMDFDETW